MLGLLFVFFSAFTLAVRTSENSRLCREAMGEDRKLSPERLQLRVKNRTGRVIPLPTIRACIAQVHQEDRARRKAPPRKHRLVP